MGLPTQVRILFATNFFTVTPYLQPAAVNRCLDATKNPYTNVDAFNINGALLVGILTFSYPYVFIVLVAFPRMQTVLRREYYDGMYHLATAFLAEMVALIPLLITGAGIFGTFNHFTIGVTQGLCKLEKKI